MQTVVLKRGQGRELPVITEVKKGREVKVRPDQSMSLKEIMRRFTKNLPIDAAERAPVYVEGNVDYDFESISRMSFDEKREFARAMQDRRKAIIEDERARKELASDEGAELTKEEPTEVPAVRKPSKSAEPKAGKKPAGSEELA